MRPRTILTPEHVEVRLVPAGPGRRFIALLVDASCAIAVAGVLTLPLRFVLPPAMLQAAAVTVTFVVGLGWYVLFEAFRQGRTPGKRSSACAWWTDAASRSPSSSRSCATWCARSTSRPSSTASGRS